MRTTQDMGPSGGRYMLLPCSAQVDCSRALCRQGSGAVWQEASATCSICVFWSPDAQECRISVSLLTLLMLTGMKARTGLSLPHASVNPGAHALQAQQGCSAWRHQACQLLHRPSSSPGSRQGQPLLPSNAFWGYLESLQRPLLLVQHAPLQVCNRRLHPENLAGVLQQSERTLLSCF